MKGHLFVIATFAVIGCMNLWAACPDVKVRPNSPCLTQFPVCAWVVVPGSTQRTCPQFGRSTSSGNFQCDQPATGNTCMGSGQFAPCYVECECTMIGLNCVYDSNNCSGHVAETKTTVNCDT